MTRNPNEVAQDYGLEYDPVRNYHTRRVRKLKYGPVERFWHRYNNDKTFQRFIDLCCVMFGIGFVTIAVMTILLYIRMNA